MVPIAWLCLRTDSAAATRHLAAALAGVLVDGDVVVLTGDLGAGKTCFTQGLGTGLGVDGPITSPTFTLVSEYGGDRLDLHHLDVYRIDDPADTIDLDLPELLETGVTVVEWGERIVEVLPDDRATLELYFAPPEPDGAETAGAVGGNPDERHLRLALQGQAWLDRLDRLRLVLAPWAVPC